MKLKELVSIITPCHNSGKFIAQTIDSVLAQSYVNWEMIIVDDNSQDQSIKIIKGFILKEDRIKLIQFGKNQGAAVARNKGIELAKGRFIAFLDSDDLWLPNKLEKQVQFMKDNSVSFSFSAYQLTDISNNLKGTFEVPFKQSYQDILKTCSIGCLTAMYDTVTFGKVYMPLIKRRQDFGLWLRLLKKVKYAYGINESLAFSMPC